MDEISIALPTIQVECEIKKVIIFVKNVQPTSMTAYTKQHNSSFVNDSHLISSLQSWVSKKEVRMHTKKDYYNVQMLFQTWKNSANYGKHLLTKTKKLQTSETVFSVHWINHIG